MMRAAVMVIVVAVLALIGASVLFGVPVFGAETDFTDVPQEHWARQSVYQMREMGITDGVGGGRFGLNDSVTRAQFVAFLSRLYGWQAASAASSTFTDVSPGDWHFGVIEAAARHGVFLENAGRFRPDDAITRGEMAVMLVRALGFAELAAQIAPHIGQGGFADVTVHNEYIALARDFGIIRGVDEQRFAPDNTATRGEAAVMMMRMFSRESAETSFLNGFYAIRSAPQMDFIPHLDAVSFGWCRFETENGEPVLNMTARNNNEFNVPAGYEIPLGMAENALLMVAVRNEMINDMTLTAHIISDANARSQAAGAIIDALEQYGFDGVTINFEEMRGALLKRGFTAFLTELRSRMPDKLLYVTVHPRPRPGLPYFDAFDFAAIGELADKVILMAHDYHAKRMTEEEMAMNFTTTPLSPIDQVYFGLKAITDEISDPSKILLQFSFEVVQWQSRDGRVINAVPLTPGYDRLAARMRADGVINYSTRLESPFVTFTADDGTQNIIWYEDSRSVTAKTRLAKMFGVNGFSLWRLGTVPDFEAELYLDVWETIKR